MRRNQAKAFAAAILLFLSCKSFAQSPGGILRQSYWMRGNPSSQTNAVNFNPVVDLQEAKTTDKLSRYVYSLRRITAFTVYENPASSQEAPVWQLTGDFGDLSLSTKQVSSKSTNTNLVFLKNQPEASKVVVNTYSGQITKRHTFDDSKDKSAAVFFGDAASSKTTSQPVVAEFILYERILDNHEAARVETYLALKYGITLAKNYVNSLGKTVWNYEADKAYSNNIAGIARDDQSSLYQKQSTSCNATGQLVIGLNKIALSNAANTGAINDKDYFIWGDNGQPFLLQDDILNEIMLLQKKWLMKVSAGSADKPSTELKIDVSSLPYTKFSKENLQLVIDRSGNGQFSADNCTYITPDNISSEGVASFSKVIWDADASGKDAFTLGIKASAIKKSAANKDAANLVLFQLYPNPVTTGQFRMAVTLDKVADIQVRVFDGSQRLVHSGKGSGQSSYIFTGYINGAAGSYTVRLTTPDTEYSRIIIVQ